MRKELLYNLTRTWYKKRTLFANLKKLLFRNHLSLHDHARHPVNCPPCWLNKTNLQNYKLICKYQENMLSIFAMFPKMFPTHVSAWLICQVSGDDCGQRQRASVKQTDAAFQENSVFFLTLTLDYSQRQGMIAKNMRDVTLIIFLCVLISIKRKFF